MACLKLRDFARNARARCLPPRRRTTFPAFCGGCPSYCTVECLFTYTLVYIVPLGISFLLLFPPNTHKHVDGKELAHAPLYQL